MYSITLGRWLQMDPLGYPEGMNAYEGMTSNPVSMVDPFGLKSTAELFSAWYKYISDAGCGGDFAGLWHGLTVDDSTNLDDDPKNKYVSGVTHGGTVYLDPAYVSGGVVKMTGHLHADNAIAATLAHELWHAYLDQILSKCPKVREYLENAAKHYGNGTSKGRNGKITDKERWIVLDEAIGVTIEDWMQQRLFNAALVKKGGAPKPERDPRAAGYISGDSSLTDQQKQDNSILSIENWKVIRYLLKYGCDCSKVDPQKIINSPEANWGTL